MNKKNLFLALLAVPLMLSGCGKSSHKPDPDPDIIDPTTYKIMVSAPTGVEYTIDKEYAAKDEIVTLVITSVAEGFDVASVQKNNAAITPEADGKTYKFAMPDRSVTIDIKVKVTGDVVIVGDFVAKLEKEGGIYVARNVKVDTIASLAKFSYEVQSGDTKTTLGALDLDESKSFGTIGLAYNEDYVFEIGSGATYDFYFDPDANLDYGRCYIQRVGVDVLPTTASGLEKLLITNHTVRSEYAVYPENYKGAHYTISDNTTIDAIYLDYDFKIYENNVSFAKVYDLTPLSDRDPMFVYKSYDKANKLYTVVDTFDKYQGAKMVNDDYYRPNYNNNTSYSGRLSVMEGDDYGYRYAVNEKHALRDVRTSAHMPHYFVERDIMEAYRVGFGSDNGVSYQNIAIVPTANVDGSFSVALDTTKEFNTNSTGSATYLGSLEEASMFDVDMTFNKAGALTSLSYKEKVFDADKWDFSSHAPKTGQKGTTVKVINASYEYGTPYSGTPSDSDFQLSDYFISSFNKNNIQFFNANFEEKHDKASGESFVGVGDKIYFVDGKGDYNPNLVNKTNLYSPSTALDLWQYGPTASTNENAISKLATDSYYQMSAHTIGKAKVTFSSHILGVGATVDVDIAVDYVTLIWYFYIMGIDTEVTSSNSADVKAGGVYSFAVGVHRSTSPMVYHPVSENPSLLKVTSGDNSTTLTIDVSSEAAKKLTTNTKVKVYMESPYYDDGFDEKYAPMVFTILPASIDPKGRWNAVSDDMPNTYVVFSEEAYDNKGNKKGYIVDEYIVNGVSKGTDTFYFYYSYNNGVLSVHIYDVNIETSTGSYTGSDFYVDFFYNSETSYYYVFLAYYEYDNEAEDYWYSAIIGDLGSSETMSGYSIDNARYSPFARVQ